MSDNNSQKNGLNGPRKRNKSESLDKLGSIGQRIKHARLSLNRTQSEFVAGIPGMTNKTLSNIEGGLTRPSMELLTHLMDHWQISPSWVLAHKGPMMLPDDGSDMRMDPVGAIPSLRIQDIIAGEPAPPLKNPEPGIKIVPITVDSTGNEAIVLVGRKVRASYINAVETQDVSSLSELPVISLPGPRWRHASFRAFEVTGDSMQTLLRPGDLVLGQRLYDWPTEIRDGEVHVIVTRDDMLVKRVQNRLIETHQLVLQSDNVQYSEQVVDGDDVLEVWACKAHIGFDFTNSSYDGVRELARTQADVAILNEEMTMMRKALEQFTGAPIQQSKSKMK